jgi:hypothetical protein
MDLHDAAHPDNEDLLDLAQCKCTSTAEPYTL